MKKIVLFISLLILCLSIASALELPENIQKVIDYNNEQALYYLESISFAIAFLAGLLAVLSPCTLAIIPMYFSYGFQKRSTLHTFVFFLGFTAVFITFGLIASILGQSILLLQSDASFLAFFAGFFLVLFGIMQILGKGFSFFPAKVFRAKSIFGVFILGVLFALGWTACTGPILAGVLLMATIIGNYAKVVLLMFLYSLGNFVPFFLLSFAVDGWKLSEKSWIRGKRVSFTLFGEKCETHTTQIISGVLLFLMGLLFLIFQDTSVFNTINIADANLKGYALQKTLLSNNFVPILGVFLLLVFLVILGYFLLRKK